MKVSEAINCADELRPGNRISVETKRRWLLSLDRNIFNDIIKQHENATVVEPSDYTEEHDAEMLLSDSDTEVYVWYIISQIDAVTAETERYNTSAERFNSLYKRFSARYTREHTPIPQGALHNIMKVGGIK